MNKLTDEELERVYSEYQENINWPAPEQVKKAYGDMTMIFDEYVGACCEAAFKNGYKYAFMHMK